MKLQSFSIVFTLIIIPILLVLTYYIQLQVDTITLQTEYDSKLLDATYDAMSSFEINTANENLSSVSDALRTIIEASNNVFFNTLSTNLGMSNASKSYVEPYIPSILYVLYDGYYIYAPTSVPEILINDENGVALAVGDYEDGTDAANGTSTNTKKYRIAIEKKDDKVYYKLEEEILSSNHGITFKEIRDENSNNVLDYGQILYKAKDLNTGAELKDALGNNLYTADPNQAVLKTKNVLKSYMPYSARYVDTNYDVTVTYTLDNYVTIEGNVGNIYYTKSGYLIDTNKLSINISDGDSISNYSETGIQELIENLNGKEIQIKIDGQEIIKLSGVRNKSDYEKEIEFLTNQVENVQLFTDSTSPNDFKSVAEKINLRFPNKIDISSLNELSNNEKSKLLQENCRVLINNRQELLDKISACVYYCKSKLFTDWVVNNFGEGKTYEIREKNIKSISGMDTITTSQEHNNKGIYDFSDSEIVVFKLTGSTKPENDKNGVIEIDNDSPFYTHKLNVIRNSIQYNLNLAMTAYSKNSTFDYAMPLIDDARWEGILSNPSVVSFMQGLSCGLKTYNNYMIVSSTNNEISILPENIYYISKSLFNDENSEYHKINCPKLNNQILKKENGDYDLDDGNKELMSFSSKEIKYDKIYNKTKSTTHFWYDHKNLACYNCINDGNYDKNNIFIKNGSNLVFPSLLKAYYIGVAKEKNNLYKPNSVSKSQGFEVIYDAKDSSNSNSNRNSSLPLNKIDYIEFVFGKISSNETKTVSLTAGSFGTFDVDSILLAHTRFQIRNLYIKSTSDSKISLDSLLSKVKIDGNNILLAQVNQVKVFYK